MLLQHRAEWSHHGGTWGLLGGARHRDEAPVAAALREAAEEAGVPAEAALVSGQYDDDHGGWSYSTVVAAEVGDAGARPTSAETVEVRWWPGRQPVGRPCTRASPRPGRWCTTPSHR